MIPNVSHAAEEESRQFPHWRRILRALPSANLLCGLGFSLAWPFLPLMVRDLGVHENLETWVGYMLLVFYLVSFAVNPIWGGIAGVQSTLSVLLERGHHAHSLPFERIASLVSTVPARRFGIAHKGSIALGHHGDLVLVDPGVTFILARDDLQQRHKMSPYVGSAFRGQVRRTIRRGHCVLTQPGATGEIPLANQPLSRRLSDPFGRVRLALFQVNATAPLDRRGRFSTSTLAHSCRSAENAACPLMVNASRGDAR